MFTLTNCWPLVKYKEIPVEFNNDSWKDIMNLVSQVFNLYDYTHIEHFYISNKKKRTIFSILESGNAHNQSSLFTFRNNFSTWPAFPFSRYFLFKRKKAIFLGFEQPPQQPMLSSRGRLTAMRTDSLWCTQNLDYYLVIDNVILNW